MNNQLEEKLMYLERHVEQLDAVVLELNRKIDALQSELACTKGEMSRRIDSINRDIAVHDAADDESNARERGTNL